MELNQLFKIQDILESNIKSLTHIKEDAIGEENVFYLKFLALQVKTGEIANLTKCYKYSTVKRNISREKLIIRYIDAWKFLLSIGNTHEFNIIDKEAVGYIEKDDNLVRIFSNIYDDIKELKDALLQDDYISALATYIGLFAKYINLGECLGLTFQEVYDYYLENSCLEKVK